MVGGVCQDFEVIWENYLDFNSCLPCMSVFVAILVCLSVCLCSFVPLIQAVSPSAFTYVFTVVNMPKEMLVKGRVTLYS